MVCAFSACPKTENRGRVRCTYHLVVCGGVAETAMSLGEDIKRVLSRILLTAHKYHCVCEGVSVWGCNVWGCNVWGCNGFPHCVPKDGPFQECLQGLRNCQHWHTLHMQTVGGKMWSWREKWSKEEAEERDCTKYARLRRETFAFCHLRSTLFMDSQTLELIQTANNSAIATKIQFHSSMDQSNLTGAPPPDSLWSWLHNKPH